MAKRIQRTATRTVEALRARLAEIAITRRDLDAEEMSVRAAVDALEKLGGEKAAEGEAGEQ